MVSVTTPLIISMLILVLLVLALGAFLRHKNVVSSKYTQIMRNAGLSYRQVLLQNKEDTAAPERSLSENNIKTSLHLFQAERLLNESWLLPSQKMKLREAGLRAMQNSVVSFNENALKSLPETTRDMLSQMTRRARAIVTLRMNQFKADEAALESAARMAEKDRTLLTMSTEQRIAKVATRLGARFHPLETYQTKQLSLVNDRRYNPL